MHALLGLCNCVRTSVLGTAKPPSPFGEPVIAANTVATTWPRGVDHRAAGVAGAHAARAAR